VFVQEDETGQQGFPGKVNDQGAGRGEKEVWDVACKPMAR